MQSCAEPSWPFANPKMNYNNKFQSVTWVMEWNGRHVAIGHKYFDKFKLVCISSKQIFTLEILDLTQR